MWNTSGICRRSTMETLSISEEIVQSLKCRQCYMNDVTMKDQRLRGLAFEVILKVLTMYYTEQGRV